MSAIISKSHFEIPWDFLRACFSWADKNRSKVTLCWPLGAEHLGSVFPLLLRGSGRSRFDVDFSNLHAHTQTRDRDGGQKEIRVRFSTSLWRCPQVVLMLWPCWPQKPPLASLQLSDSNWLGTAGGKWAEHNSANMTKTMNGVKCQL